MADVRMRYNGAASTFVGAVFFAACVLHTPVLAQADLQPPGETSIFPEPDPDFRDPVPIQADEVAAAPPSEEAESPLTYSFGEESHIRLLGELEYELFDPDTTEPLVNKFTFKPGVNVQFSRAMSLEAIFEFATEQGSDSILVDEVFVTAGDEEAFPASLRIGYYTVPFGIFDSLAITSQLIQDAFEIKGDTVEVGVDLSEFTLGESLQAVAYGFRERSDWFIYRDKDIEPAVSVDGLRWGANLEGTFGIADTNFRWGLGVTNALGDSLELTRADLHVPDAYGGSAHVEMLYGDFLLRGDLIAAFGDTPYLMEGDPDEEEPDSVTFRRPVSYSVEVGYVPTFGDKKFQFVVNYSRTSDLRDYFTEQLLSFTAATELFEEHLYLGIEFGRAWDYRDPETDKRPSTGFVAAKATLKF